MTAKTEDAQLEKIARLREKASEMQAEKERLAGAIETQEAAIAEMEVNCKEQFGCDVDGLEELATSLSAEAECLVKEAEGILAQGQADG